jgi:tetratricopeptide (TPR) repeat protein
VEGLLATLRDTDEVPLHRANAVGYLGRFPKEPAVFGAFVRALQDKADPVRAVAALRINATADKVAAVTALGTALVDRVASVRLAAAVSLAALQLKQFPAGFEEARQLYASRNSLNNDDPMLQFSAGKFFLLAGDAQDAAEALRTSIQLDPGLGASYFLAYAYAMQGKYGDARGILEGIPARDPQYRNAQELLTAIRGR